MKYLTGASLLAMLISDEAFSLTICAVWLIIGLVVLIKEQAAHNY